MPLTSSLSKLRMGQSPGINPLVQPSFQKPQQQVGFPIGPTQGPLSPGSDGQTLPGVRQMPLPIQQKDGSGFQSPPLVGQSAPLLSGMSVGATPGTGGILQSATGATPGGFESGGIRTPPIVPPPGGILPPPGVPNPGSIPTGGIVPPGFGDQIPASQNTGLGQQLTVNQNPGGFGGTGIVGQNTPPQMGGPGTTPPTKPGGGQFPGVPGGQPLPGQPPGSGGFGGLPGGQFGLSAAENARRQGMAGAMGAFGSGTNNAMGTLLAGFDRGSQFLNQNFGSGGATAQAGQGRSFDVDPNTGQPLFGQASQGVNQFTQAGVNAQQRASDLMGNNGQAAFDAAMLNNPNIDFLNKRGQDALVNQNAATGGLGSGQFQIELQQLGQAQAAQNLQQQIQNSMGLSNQGLQAAGQSGQFLAQGAQQQGALAGQNAAQSTQASLQNAGLATNASIASAGNQTQAGIAGARNRLGAAQTGAQLAGQLSAQGANFQNQTGRDIGQLISGTGRDIATDRIRAGQDIAGNIASTTSGLGQLQNTQGAGIADILSQFGINASNLSTGAGGAASNSQAQLAALLANISQGQGTTLGNLALQGGNTQAQSSLFQGANQNQLMDNLLQASQLISSENNQSGTQSDVNNFFDEDGNF